MERAENQPCDPYRSASAFSFEHGIRRMPLNAVSLSHGIAVFRQQVVTPHLTMLRVLRAFPMCSMM